MQRCVRGRNAACLALFGVLIHGAFCLLLCRCCCPPHPRLSSGARGRLTRMRNNSNTSTSTSSGGTTTSSSGGTMTNMNGLNMNMAAARASSIRTTVCRKQLMVRGT